MSSIKELKQWLPEGATVEEDQYSHQKTITICAPEGRTWKCNGNGVVLSSYYLPASRFCNRRRSIQSLIRSAKEGLE